MTRRIFEFQCEEGHLMEKFIDDSVTETPCEYCDQTAYRIISQVRVSLDGCSGDFPTAYDAWERKRAEKSAQERKTSGSE